MASYDDLIKIAGNNDFQQRIKYALMAAAVNVYAEASSTTGHTARAALASNVIQGGYNPAAAALAVLTNSTIASEANVSITPGFNIVDADIQFAINSLWGALANA